MSFAIIDGHAVFMDERNDSYFQLTSKIEEHLYALLDRHESPAKDKLVQQALGVTDGALELICAECSSPLRSLLDSQGRSRPNLIDVITAAYVVQTTRSLLRCQPIERVLNQLEATVVNGDAGRRNLTDFLAETRRFRNARRFVPLKANCLVDSLSLLRWLGQLRDKVTLVFGVKLNPFAAHCWLQSGDLILNDRRENVAAFTPVRAITCSGATR